MPEIKSVHSREDIAQYARDNQLDVANQTQIAAKFLELETRITFLEERYENHIAWHTNNRECFLPTNK